MSCGSNPQIQHEHIAPNEVLRSCEPYFEAALVYHNLPICRKKNTRVLPCFVGKGYPNSPIQKGRNLGWITHIHPVSISRIISIQTSQNGVICPEFPQVYSQHNSHFYYSHYAQYMPSMTRFGFVAFDGLKSTVNPPFYRIKSPIFYGEISQFGTLPNEPDK